MSQIASDVGGQPDVLAPSEEEIKGKTPWQLFWARFKKDKLALLGVAFVVILILLAFTAPLFAKFTGHGPNSLEFRRVMTDEFGIPRGPSIEQKFYFGADLVGRDLFVRVIYGTRTSLLVAVVATGISGAIGIVLGITAGFFRGPVDTIISRAIDLILSMPLILFAIGIVAACSVTQEGCLGGLVEPGLPLVIFIISIFSWPYIARIVRGNTLSIREKEFIEASRSLGASNRRIMFKEVLPNLVAPIIVYATLIIPSNILFEAVLSFLGLGVPQSTPSWGRMLSDAARIFEFAPWLMIFPGVFLFFTTLAFNLLGDGLRDALDPRTGR
jgi:peptide/nickel transport system permease protein